MSKRVLFMLICIALLLFSEMYAFYKPEVFSCESQFSVVQNINNDSTHAEGLIFFSMADDSLLIDIDGLISHNKETSLISRTLKIQYETYNSDAHLYKITSIKTLRDVTDNVDEKIAVGLLFGKGSDEKIIYLKKLNNNVMLFGNHTLPQYGCKLN